jgi:hypothetical protein
MRRAPISNDDPAEDHYQITKLSNCQIVQLRLHLLHHPIRRRAVFNILLVYMNEILQLLGKMREAGAVCRADSIDAAFIIGQIEKLAGLLFIQPIAVLLLFLIEPLSLELLYGLAEMRGDPLQVFLVECRRHRLAAIRAAKAIRFQPHFLFQFGGQPLHAPGRLLLQFSQECAQAALVAAGFLFKGAKVHGFHFFHAPKVKYFVPRC